MNNLPSEAAQSLANYLRENENEFLGYFPGEDERVILIPNLAKVIQEYWDSLL